MRLYATDDAPGVVIDDPEFGTFTADEHGMIEGLPEALFERLHRVHVEGKQMWESEEERDARLTAEDTARRRDPQTLLDAVTRLETAPARELTAAELREAYEERKRIRDEEDAEALAKLEKAEKAATDQAAAEAADAQAEADRIAGLPIIVGDMVRITGDGHALFPDIETSDTGEVLTVAAWHPEDAEPRDMAEVHWASQPEGTTVSIDIALLEKVEPVLVPVPKATKPAAK